MRSYIMSEIERRRAELTALDHRRVVITAQLSLLEEMLTHASDAGEPRHADASRQSHSRDKGRLSSRWMPVLIEAVRRYPGTVRGEHVPEIQKAAGEEPAPLSNVRSHFWTNSQPGKFYERVAAGEYRATAHGAEVAGLPLGGGETSRSENSNGADHEPAPSSFENRDEPQSVTARFDLLNPHKVTVPGGGT